MAVIDTYFRELMEKGASDLHMVVGCPPLLRLKGELVETGHPVLDEDRMKEVLWEILPEEKQAEFQENLDLDMAYELEGVGRFRCNFFSTTTAPVRCSA